MAEMFYWLKSSSVGQVPFLLNFHVCYFVREKWYTHFNESQQLKYLPVVRSSKLFMNARIMEMSVYIIF